MSSILVSFGKTYRVEGGLDYLRLTFRYSRRIWYRSLNLCWFCGHIYLFISHQYLWSEIWFWVIVFSFAILVFGDAILCLLENYRSLQIWCDSNGQTCALDLISLSNVSRPFSMPNPMWDYLLLHARVLSCSSSTTRNVLDKDSSFSL